MCHMVNHIASLRLSRLCPRVKYSVITNCFETFQADSHLISSSNNKSMNCLISVYRKRYPMNILVSVFAIVLGAFIAAG